MSRSVGQPGLDVSDVAAFVFGGNDLDGRRIPDDLDRLAAASVQRT
jgi:hypothetical protein